MPSDNPIALQNVQPCADCNKPLGFRLPTRTSLGRRKAKARLAALLARGQKISDEIFEAAVMALDRIDAIDIEFPEQSTDS